MSPYNPIDRNVRQVPSRRRQAHRCRPRLEALEPRETPTVTVFQQGVAGYTGTQDAELSVLAPDRAGDFATMRVAGPTDAGGQVQGLIRFDNLFGAGTNQIPIGARINAAALTFEVPAASNSDVVLSRMLVDWNESSTWNSLVGGVQTNGTEALATPDSRLSPAQGLGPRAFDVTSSVQAWSYAQAIRGWVLVMPTGNDFWEVEASETLGTRPPILAVDWTAPTAGTFNFSAPTYSVGEAGGTVTITVNRTDGGMGAVAVNYAATGGTATSGQDFSVTPGTLNFAANEFTKTFTVAITNDILAEPDETINLALSSPTGGAVLGPQATAVVTIGDNDGPGVLQFSAATYSENEDDGTATVTVNRVRASDGTVTVAYAATRGSATPGVDFTATTGTLTFGPGEISKTFTISIINDIILETPERIVVTLSNPTGGATLGSPSTAFVTINDNEPPFTFQEGVSGYAATLDAEIRSGEPTTPRGNDPTITVDLDEDGNGSIAQGLLRFENIFGNGPNQIPFGSTIIQGTLSFQATSSSDGRISIHRMLVNWDESSTWSSFGGNGIQANNVEASSAEDGFLFPATGTGPRTIDARDALQAWSNAAGNFGWVFLNTTGDGWDFASSENATVAQRPRLTVLAAPPTPGQLNFSVADYPIDETGPSVTVTVTRSGGAVGAVSVNYAATSGTAVAGQDFTAVAGSLSWVAGDGTPKTFTVAISNDTLVEGDETINLALSNPTGGAVLGEVPDATVTILDDDTPGTLQFSAPTFTVNENGAAAILTVSRTRGSAGTVTVAYAAGTGTATVGLDFTGATGIVTFGPGETSKTITIPIVDDGLDELNETVAFTLSNATGGATLGSQTSAVLRIIDNERSLTIQDGFNGYAGTQDTNLRAATPDTADGGAATVIADLVDAALQVQGLLRFDTLFGTGPNQVPANATIHSATLTVQVSNATPGAISLHRMLANWNETSTWNALTNGVQFVTEAALIPESPAAVVAATGARSFDVTSSLRVWLSSTNPNASNLGWLFHNTSDDGWAFQSSEDTIGLNRPRLEVVYTAAAATTPLQVTSLGVITGLNHPVDTSVLNVFGSASDPLGPPDVTLVGPNGRVAGSVVFNPTGTGVSAPFGAVATFVPTALPVTPGIYTITLRSAANGFRTLYGGLLLDGNGDGTAGDDLTSSFPLLGPAAGARFVSLPKFLRGPGQAYLPTGLPIRLSDGQGVTAVSLQIRYDPALLDITAATAVPAGSAVTFNSNTPGVVQVNFTSTNALAAGPVEFVRLTATVRADAPYSAKHFLDLANVTINTGTTTVPAVEDNGLHIVSYLGDTNGNGAYESADAVLLGRYIAGTDLGFAAFQLADPALVGDITQDGRVDANDTTAATQLAAGMTVPNVPARPALPAGLIPGGPDPQLYLPTTLVGAVGQTVTVPVLLEVTDPAGVSVTGVDVALRYDASRFAISNARLGDLLAGFGLSVNAQTPGEMRLVAVATWGPELAFGASGALFLVDVTVLPGAATGVSAFNLVASLGGTTTALYGNDLRSLTLLPAPTDAADDPGDGLFTVVAAAPGTVVQAGPVLDGEQGSDRRTAAGSDESESRSVALALLLGGNRGGATAADARDAFFNAYGSESDSDAAPVGFAPAFRSGLAEGRTSGAASQGPEEGYDSHLFDVNALFASLADRS